MKRLALVLMTALALPAGLALAGTEEEDTQAPATTPTPGVRFRGTAVGLDGDRDIARELSGEPDRVRAGFRSYFPITGKEWTGGHAADVSTTREGTVRAWARSPSGRRVDLRMSADRRPLAFRTRVPFASSELEEAGTHRESARLTFSAPIPSRKGRVEVFGEWRGGGGLRPSTAAAYAPGDAGPAFLAPAWRRGDHGSASVGASIRGTVADARVTVDGRLADESLRSRFVAPDRLAQGGGLSIFRDERRRAGEAGVSVDVPMGSLLAGGSYRFRAVQTESRGDRRQDTPSTLPGETTLDDGDVRTLTHRGSLGVAFLPIPSVRTGVTATAISQRLRAESSERRDLADESVSRGEADLDSFTTSVNADGAWLASAWLTVEARGALETARFEDEWTQALLAPGAGGAVSERAQVVTRDRALTKLEGSVTAGPWRGVRATAGAISERETLDVTADRVVDSPVFGDRTRERETAYLRLRSRPVRGVTVDGRAKAFTESRDLGETEPERRGSEVRGRVAYSKDGASIFGVAAFGDDRHELAPLPADAGGSAYLPIEFEGRSWIWSAGVVLPLTKTWLFSATGTRVIHAGDLDSRLLDVSADVGGALNETLRLSAGVRSLEWDDDRAPWHEADALVGFVLLSGSL